MKKIILLLVVPFLFAIGCNSNSGNKETAQEKLTQKELLQKIQNSEKDLFKGDVIKIDKKTALNLIKDYQQYAKRFPNDSLAPEFLFKASDISMNMASPTQTISIFNNLINNYPDYNKTETCYFLRAFVYDDQLKDYKTAEKYYKEFLKKYPESDFADDAQMLLNNLGKSPEELIKEFSK